MRAASTKATTTTATPTTVDSNKVPDFEDFKSAYASKSTIDLMRGYLVLSLCRPSVISRAEGFLHLSYRVLGETLTAALIRHTFFRHFCAGESEGEARALMRKLEGYGVRGILDFAAEGDVASIKLAEKSSALSRSYVYESETVCDERMKEFEHCVKVAGKGGFAAVKVTALGDPEVIKRYATTILAVQNVFKKFTSSKDIKTLTRGEFRDRYNENFHGGDEAANELFNAVVEGAKVRFVESLDGGAEDRLDFHEWTVYMDARRFVALEMKSKSRAPSAAPMMTQYEVDLIDNIFSRLSHLAFVASEQGARLMIDAEQTYFQPAIDLWTLALQREHNDFNGPAVVFSTYQAYLRDAAARLDFALRLSQRERWTFACKLVRGAYMIQENKLAAERGTTSPINPNIETTAENYNACVKAVLAVPQSEIVVASHNLDSIRRVLVELQTAGASGHGALKPGAVSFAQLLGMSDNITFTLAQMGYPVYKYLPFGPVNLVVPYLMRRAQENSSVMAGANREKRFFVREIRRRLLGG